MVSPASRSFPRPSPSPRRSIPRSPGPSVWSKPLKPASRGSPSSRDPNSISPAFLRAGASSRPTARTYSAYTQETARLRLNQIIRTRALAELYDAPFKAVVQQAHVASLMCSYGELNGVNTCSDPSIYATLKSWGFTGFVRSDLGAVANMTLAFRAGMSLMKPGSPATLVRLVHPGSVTTAQLNQAVRSVLVPMFNAGLIAHPLHGSLTAVATTPAHAATALSAATQSIVLLKNQGSILPLGRSEERRVGK